MVKKVNRISKTVATFNNISVKHLVYKTETNPKTNKLVDLSSEYIQEHLQHSDGSSIIINIYTKTREGISLESTEHKLNDIPISSYITYTNVYEMLELLDECSKWLKGDEYKNIFKYTSNGLPFGLSERFSGLSYTIYMKGSNNRYIIAIPAVIHDNESTYTGIRLKNEKGIIGDLTNSEFFNMKTCIENLCKNLYTNSMLLSISETINGEKDERNR